MHIINDLKSRFDAGLPGPQVQYEMAPLGRVDFEKTVRTYRKAAVLSLIYPKHDDWHMVFIKRTTHEKDTHSAQISFPGGKIEKKDPTYTATALREAEEEISLNPNLVSIIGGLTPLKIPVSGFEVFPILAYSKETLDFTPQASEVQYIIEIPLSQLVDSSFKTKSDIKMSNGFVINDVPIFNYGGNVIWGATAMMLNEVIHLLQS